MSAKADQLVRDAEGHLALKIAGVEVTRGDGAVARKIRAVIELREACGVWLAAVEHWTHEAEKGNRS